MYSARGNAALPALGFPIRKSADHRLFSASPRLIAAVHVLHRLLVPRHPPCALDILTVIKISIRRRPPKRVPTARERITALGDTRYWPTVQFSRSAEAPSRPVSRPTAAAHRLEAGLSKLNSML